MYNSTVAGDVNNIASAEATMDDESFRDEDSDLISILDGPLNVNFTKAWTGGPLGVPQPGTPQDQYPSGRVTLVATNTTVAKVDKMQIVDAKPGGNSPFDVFNLKRIVSISNGVNGADPSKTLVVLTNEDGSIIVNPATPSLLGVTPGYAVTLTAAQLANVERIEVTYEGRIVSGAKATVQMDLQLRATHRSDGTPVTTVDSPVRNEAVGIVEDAGGILGIHHVEADNEAQIALESLNIDVVTTKTFDPVTQTAVVLPSEQPEYDNEEWESITTTLSARPSGSARPAKLVVTDDTETFWNVYRFEGFAPSFALAAPIDQVQVDALVGGTFTEGPGASLSLVGASWELGVPGATPALPAGVNPEDVQGLRFTFTKADGTQWENPANPKQEIPLIVHRRAYLESSQSSVPKVPVPWKGLAAPGAPGEPGGINEVPGRFTNTVVGEVTSAVNNSENVPLTASHETTAQTRYEAGGTDVSVTKSPVGSQAPGQIIPFTLTVKNTAPLGSGEAKSILDPVITDHLPVDGDGNPMLVFDPESSEPKFSYAFTPGETPTDPSTTIPTDPALVSVEEITNSNGETTDIIFRFPDDTLLWPGESYTITINMMFRPGIGAGEHIKNVFDIEAAEPFDSCNGVISEDAGFAACADDTDVYPSEIGALRGQKLVRADDDELGVTDVANPAASDQCEPTIDDANGAYYSGNCVPLTKPLGTETWRERVQNTGSLEMDKVVTIDRLPTPDDQGALVLLPRDSQWQPTWEGFITPVVVNGNRTPDAVAYYCSSDADPCVADLYPATDACPPGSWLPLTDGVDPASVKHIKTEFDFSSNHFLPGEFLGYTFQTRTPAVSLSPTADTVAWNTIAIGAHTVTSEGEAIGEVLPTEGRRVGVALASGPLQVEKLVEGEGAEFAPDTFALQVLCTVTAPDDSGLTVELDPILIEQEIEPGAPVTIDEQLPWGAECQVVDQPGVNGETSSQPTSPVTIGRDSDPVQLSTLTNTYDLASFEVDKVVEGAVDQDGDPIDYGSFLVAASCTFLGEDLVLNPAEAEITAGGLGWLVDQLPVGAECTIAELDGGGAQSSLMIDDQVIEPNEDHSWTFTLTPEQPDIQLVLTNVFPLGAIVIEKEIEGLGAAAVSDDTTFEFEIYCTYEGEPVWDGTVTFTKAEALAGEQRLIDTLPLGASCAVAETATGGATLVGITPDTSEGPVEVGSVDEPLVFTAVNTFAAGALYVTKDIVGEGAERYGAGPFAVTLVCTLEGNPVNVPGGDTRELTAESGYEAVYTEVPVGSECELTETLTGGATSSEIVYAEGGPVTEPVVIEDTEEGLWLRVINTFDVGSIEVKKTIAGAGASLANDKVFTVERDGLTEAVDIPGGSKRELSKSGGLIAGYEMLPVGAECELRETHTGGAASTSITPNAGDAAVGTVTVAEDGPVTINVVNEFAALPSTGSTSNAAVWWGLGGAGLLIAGAVLLTVRLRRRSALA